MNKVVFVCRPTMHAVLAAGTGLHAAHDGDEEEQQHEAWQWREEKRCFLNSTSVSLPGEGGVGATHGRR